MRGVSHFGTTSAPPPDAVNSTDNFGTLSRDKLTKWAIFIYADRPAPPSKSGEIADNLWPYEGGAIISPNRSYGCPVLCNFPTPPEAVCRAP